MKKICALILLLVVITGATGCTPVSQREDASIIEMVKEMEKNGHLLANFEITYDQYKENTDRFIEKGFANKENQSLFGFDGKEFRGKDLVGVTQEEMSQLKEKLKVALKDSFGEVEYDTVYISDVYNEETKNWKYVFTKENVKFEKRSDIINYKKYMFHQSEDTWKIIGISYMTYSSDWPDPKSIEQYEKYGGQEIKFNHTLNVKN